MKLIASGSIQIQSASETVKTHFGRRIHDVDILRQTARAVHGRGESFDDDADGLGVAQRSQQERLRDCRSSWFRTGAPSSND